MTRRKYRYAFLWISVAVMAGHPAWANLQDFKADETATQILKVHPEISSVLDTAHFDDAVRRTHQLLHPPKNLHPWLKWLLYSSRIDRNMIQNYYATLKKRDQIYERALKNAGHFAVLYRDKVFQTIPPYVTPDWAEGDYSLVLLRETSRQGQASPAVPAPALSQAKIL